jgi:hypothetical protein
MRERELAEVVHVHRAARTASRRPTVHTLRKHEVVKQELRAAFEQVEKCHLPIGAVERVFFLDTLHGQASPLGRQRVAGMCKLLFLRE